jgi:hypothetical protein
MKHQVLAEYAARFRPRIFIETGTLRGDTIKAMLLTGQFDRLYTMDVNPVYAQKAQRRFARFPQVHALHGDSGTLLRTVLSLEDGPCLFWLDAHLAGTHHDHYVIHAPLRQELATILAHPRAAEHVLLIDDAWYFDNEEWREVLPSIRDIEGIIKARFPDWVFEVDLDILRAHRP